MSNLGGKTVSEDTDKDLGVDSIVAGANIDNIDSTDPRNPIINAAAGGAAVAARVTRTTNQTMDASEAIQFVNEEYDDDGGFADLTSNNDRLTIPTGVTRVNLSVFIQAQDHTTGTQLQLMALLFSAGDSFIRAVAANDIQVGDSTPRMSISALGVVVVPGEYILISTTSGDSSWTLTEATYCIQDVSP